MKIYLIKNKENPKQICFGFFYQSFLFLSNQSLKLKKSEKNLSLDSL